MCSSRCICNYIIRKNFMKELEGWSEYVKCLEQFFEVKGIIGDDNKAQLSCPGPYKLLKSILGPVKLSDKTFEQLVDALQMHCNLHHQKWCIISGSIHKPTKAWRISSYLCHRTENISRVL